MFVFFMEMLINLIINSKNTKIVKYYYNLKIIVF